MLENEWRTVDQPCSDDPSRMTFYFTAALLVKVTRKFRVDLKIFDSPRFQRLDIRGNGFVWIFCIAIMKAIDDPHYHDTFPVCPRHVFGGHAVGAAEKIIMTRPETWLLLVVFKLLSCATELYLSG